MLGFNVTYERYIPDYDAEEPETEIGFLAENVSLREALELVPVGSVAEANEWPVIAPRWITAYNVNAGSWEYLSKGIIENRSLHIPDNVTDSSRKRIARLFAIV